MHLHRAVLLALTTGKEECLGTKRCLWRELLRGVKGGAVNRELQNNRSEIEARGDRQHKSSRGMTRLMLHY